MIKRVATLLMVANPVAGIAAGYAIAERDAAGLGRAFAGQAALIEGASVGINPAAIPEAGTAGASLSGIWNDLQPEDAGGSAVVPAAFATYRGFGLALDAPYGLSTDYPADWSGRYSALYSAINTWRVTAAGGWQATPTLRLGAGFFLQHMDATLTQAYPLGPLGDAEIKVDGADLSPGFTLGAHWQPRENLGLGLAYASPVWFELDGNARLPFGSVPASVKVVTPESITAGLAWDVAPRWRALGGATWTRWSRLQDLDIRLANGSSMVEEHNWRDAWRVSLGGEHERGPWTFRAGLAWDQSPIPDEEHRYPRLPGADRTWLAVGVGYQTGPWSLNAGYAHLFSPDRSGDHPPIDYSSSTDSPVARHRAGMVRPVPIGRWHDRPSDIVVVLLRPDRSSARRMPRRRSPIRGNPRSPPGQPGIDCRARPRHRTGAAAHVDRRRYRRLLDHRHIRERASRPERAGSPAHPVVGSLREAAAGRPTERRRSAAKPMLRRP